jgi:hypothetical protein
MRNAVVEVTKVANYQKPNRWQEGLQACLKTGKNALSRANHSSYGILFCKRELAAKVTKS